MGIARCAQLPLVAERGTDLQIAVQGSLLRGSVVVLLVDLEAYGHVADELVTELTAEGQAHAAEICDAGDHLKPGGEVDIVRAVDKHVERGAECDVEILVTRPSCTDDWRVASGRLRYSTSVSRASPAAAWYTIGRTRFRCPPALESSSPGELESGSYGAGAHPLREYQVAHN